jgi:hypothetical protein
MALFARPRPADILDGTVDYLVDTPDGSVGVVDGWERDEHGRPQTLIVSQGWFGRRRFEIPLEALVEIDHEDRRIILARDAAPLEPKRPLQRLAELGQDRSAEGAAMRRVSGGPDPLRQAKSGPSMRTSCGHQTVPARDGRLQSRHRKLRRL